MSLRSDLTIAQSLEPLLRPRSVAILGASTDPSKIGGRPLRYLKAAGYRGAIYPVNPRAERVQDVPAFPSIAEVPGPVDLAILALPAAATVAAVENCAARGVRGAVIFSAGFAEVGEEGRQAQARITEIARAAGMRVFGPNCLGLFNPREGLYATFSSTLEHGWPQPGAIGIVSQSGAFGSHCFVLARERGLGISYWMTTGNEADVDFADCLAFLAEDEGTRVIMGYVEGCRDRDRLLDALALACARRKPVVLMKVGASDVGALAVASHTAALAGSDAVYAAVFRQYNVHRARSIDELLNVATACAAGVYPAGRRLGLVTMSGGVGVLMADAAAEQGLEVPPLPEAAQARLKALLPFAAARNPVDTTAQIYNDMSLITKSFEIMLTEGGYDAVIGFFTTIGLIRSLADPLRDAMADLRRRFPESPIALSVVCTPEVKREFEAEGVLIFEDPTDAVAAVAALMRLGTGFAAGSAPARKAGGPGAASSLPPGVPNEHEAKTLLARAGIPVVEERLAGSAEEAEQAAAAIGFPVVLKLVSPDLRHKSEIGGVLLGLDSPSAVREGFEVLMERGRGIAARPRLDGVSVAPMIRGGVETILGVQRDPVFGPVVMFGLGGIFVEVLRDVTFRIAPFDEVEAQAMIREVKGFPLLDGARGRPKADIDALARALARLSEFAHAHSDALESIDLNPFIVLPAGQGAVAVDALILPRAAREG